MRRTIAPGDFAADLHAWRGNALGLAHTLDAERRVPPAQRLAQGRRPAVRGRVGPARHRPADVPHLGRARGQAPARRPLARARCPSPRGEGLTCRGSTSLAILVSSPASLLLDCALAARRPGRPRAHGRGGRDRHGVLPRVGCRGHRDRRLREGRQPAARSASTSRRSFRSRSLSSSRSSATSRWSCGRARCASRDAACATPRSARAAAA